MLIKKIYYSKRFYKHFKKIPENIIVLGDKKIELFRKNPLHSSLRLHPLQGKLCNLWLISINKNYRIIFQRLETGDIVFISIGKHDVYKNL